MSVDSIAINTTYL